MPNVTIKTTARRDQRAGRYGCYRGYVTIHEDGRKLYGIHTNAARLTREDAIDDARIYAHQIQHEL